MTIGWLVPSSESELADAFLGFECDCPGCSPAYFDLQQTTAANNVTTKILNVRVCVDAKEIKKVCAQLQEMGGDNVKQLATKLLGGTQGCEFQKDRSDTWACTAYFIADASRVRVVAVRCEYQYEWLFWARGAASSVTRSLVDEAMDSAMALVAFQNARLLS